MVLVMVYIRSKRTTFPLVKVQILTFVAMRNLFQSSLLAAAEDRSTLFLTTG